MTTPRKNTGNWTGHDYAPTGEFSEPVQPGRCMTAVIDPITGGERQCNLLGRIPYRGKLYCNRHAHLMGYSDDGVRIWYRAQYDRIEPIKVSKVTTAKIYVVGEGEVFPHTSPYVFYAETQQEAARWLIRRAIEREEKIADELRTARRFTEVLKSRYHAILSLPSTDGTDPSSSLLASLTPADSTPSTPSTPPNDPLSHSTLGSPMA